MAQKLAHVACQILPLVIILLLSACASTAPGGRSQMVAPNPISSLYSTLDLNLTLASRAAVQTPCSGIQCQVDKGFERQVARLGARLARTAYDNYPSLQERIPKFNFVVAEKTEGGSSSDASGTIVIYRGVRKTALPEESLAYLIAGEMGHVIARHHDEKSAAAIISSLVAQVVLAPANLARGVAFLVSSTATALGKNILAEKAADKRVTEADTIALDLLYRQGWNGSEIADSLMEYSNRLEDDAWSNEIKIAATRLSSRKSSDLLALVQPD